MLEMLGFSYKKMTSLLIKVVLKTTRLAAKNPIEMMVASLLLGSVTYVYLFNLAKSSEVLASAAYQSSDLSTILYAAPEDALFSPLGDQYPLMPLSQQSTRRLELKQLKITLQEDTLSKDSLINILLFQDYIEYDLHFSDGRLANAWTYKDNLCYRPSNSNKCLLVKSPLDVYRYALKKSHHLEYEDLPLSQLDIQYELTLSYIFDLNDHYHVQAAGLWEKRVLSSSVDRLVPLPTNQYHGESMSTIVWLARVIKSLFKDASAKFNSASKVDVIVVFIGYVLMASVFLSLYIRMHRLGSKYSLATTIFMNGFFSFMLALATVYKLGAPVSPVLLSEATPFLVVTIGFERPYKLTQRIFEENSKSIDNNGGRRTTTRFSNSVHHVIARAVESIAPTLIRDALLEIVLFFLGAKSSTPGLREFCLMAVFVIAFDVILMFTWYIAVLCLKLELRRIQDTNVIKVGVTNSGHPNNNCASSSRSTISREHNRINSKKPHIIKAKLIMIIAFLSLHVFEFCSTISFTASRNNSLLVPKTSITGSTIEPILASVLQHHRESTNGDAVGLLLKVSSPLKFQLLTSTPAHILSWTPTSITTLIKVIYSTYTIYAQDPVINRWIVAILMISVLLNTYLFEIVKRPKAQQATNSSSRYEKYTPRVKSHHNHRTYKQVSSITSNESSPLKLLQPYSHNERQSVPQTRATRTLEECLQILKNQEASNLADEELLTLVQKSHIAPYSLEKVIDNLERAVHIQEMAISRASTTQTLETSALPMNGYNYGKVLGTCCENVIGYMPLPVGVGGPMIIDGDKIHLPMATTEDCLVASVTRGCKAVNAGGGAVTVLLADGMTRGPCVEFPTIVEAGQCKQWMESLIGFDIVAQAFNSRFARVKKLQVAMAGRLLFIRFSAMTDDEMNTISNSCEKALAIVAKYFPTMHIVSLFSGNYCAEKKSAAINWIEGHGKFVIAEAVIPRHVVESVLKTSIDALLELNMSKNLIGSAMAGSIGGFNAHAANILTAMYIAAGQNAAQNVESSNCITLMKSINHGQDLHISCSMPSIEVGTVSGTILAPQLAMLDMLGVCDPHLTSLVKNPQKLARIICAAVMAGELSFCAALAAGHLVKAHMQDNRAHIASHPTDTNTTKPNDNKESSLPSAPRVRGECLS